MRIWCVPCRDLDNMRLLGEHRELHMLVSMIRIGEERGGIQTFGITKYYAKRFNFLDRRHEEQIKEMRKRGYSGHKSALPLADMFKNYPWLEKTTHKSGWTSGGAWFKSTKAAKRDLSVRWDSGQSRFKTKLIPKWTNREPPKWYKPADYAEKQDNRFGSTGKITILPITTLAAHLPLADKRRKIKGKKPIQSPDNPPDGATKAQKKSFWRKKVQVAKQHMEVAKQRGNGGWVKMLEKRIDSYTKDMAKL